MKHLVKLLCLSAALAVAPLAYAIPITGSIGFGGNGTYNNVTGAFTAGAIIPAYGTNAYVNVPGTGSLTMFTQNNPATFFNFSTSAPPASIFTTTEAGSTLTFTLTGVTSTSGDAPGPGFVGTGILTQTGFDNTLATFSLNTIAGAGTFITFNTAAVATTPEPSSLVLLGSGLVSAAGMLIRRRRLV